MPSILIADSDHATRARLARQAAALGVAVEEVAELSQVRHALATGAFDLVVLGVSAELDGAVVLAGLRGQGDQRAVIMLLSELNAAAFAPLMRLGVSGYLLRSHGEREITAVLRKALRSQPAPSIPAEATASTRAELPAPLVARPARATAPAVPAGAGVRAAIERARVLLVGLTPAQVEPIAAGLLAAGLEGRIPSDADATMFDLVRRDSRFVAVVARLAGLHPLELEQLKNLAYATPSLNVLVAAAPGHEQVVRELERLEVRRVVRDPIEPFELVDRVVECVTDTYLDLPAVEFIRTLVSDLLGDSPLGVEPAIIHYRVAASLLAPIAGIVEVSGPDLVGRLIVSGEPLVLARIARHWLGEVPRTRDMVWDAMGELTNRVAAAIRHHYRRRGLVSSQSPPLVIEGAATEIRQLTRMPSVVFTFEVARPSGQVHVEWQLAHRIVATALEPGATDQPPQPRTGELDFL